jgi:hypothetical protein
MNAIHTAYSVRRDNGGTFYSAFAYANLGGIKTGMHIATGDTKEEALRAVVTAVQAPFIAEGLTVPQTEICRGKIAWSLGHNWLY